MSLIQGPDAVWKAQGLESHHCLQWVVDLEHVVAQHVLEDTADLQDGFPSGCFALLTPKRWLTYCRLVAMVSLRRVWATQVSVGRGGHLVVGCHSRCRPSWWSSSWNVAWVIQSLVIIIPRVLDNAEPPVPADLAGSQAARLESQELMDNTHGGVYVDLVSLPAAVQEAAQGLVANSPRVVSCKPGCEPGTSGWQGGQVEAHLSQAVVTAEVKHSECGSKEKPVALVLTSEAWVWSSYGVLGSGSGDSVLEDCARRLLQARETYGQGIRH